MTDDHAPARPRKVTPAQAAGILAERGDRRPPHHGPRDRPVVGRNVPVVPAPPPRRLAHRRPRHPQGLCPGTSPTPAPKQLDALGEPYRPYRSVVAWYCWRAAQLYAGAKAGAVTS
jgi:hypothetical protein